MPFYLPQGFRYSGVHCGIKSDPNELDLTLVISDFPATVAGTYTQNLVYGAAVEVDRSRTPGTGFRALIANSRCANDCTGEQGLRDALEMTALAAKIVDADPDQALVMSTGVIGTFMPMDKIKSGLLDAEKQLANDENAFLRAARGILTTDTHEKVASRQMTFQNGQIITIAGFCKGAAMIAPNMRTMLALIVTDILLLPSTAQEFLSEAVEKSFNCISVEGHTSPSDTVLLYANGAAELEPMEKTAPKSESDLELFQTNLVSLCRELAKMIPEDGEGASHLITLDVLGCYDRESAKKIAQAVANDPLVKTAICGADPNWGRIISMAGNAGVAFNPMSVSLSINGHELFQQGTPLPFDPAVVSESIRSQKETHIVLSFGEGDASIRFWTCDLTSEYVKLNSEYTT